MVRRAMMAHSARSVLIVDHAKFGRPAPLLLGRLDEFDLLITDAGVGPADLALAGQHIEVQVVAPA